MPKTVFTGAHQDMVDVLKAARKQSGLSQAELGQRIGKSQGFISLIERSQRRVDVLEFYALAKALNKSPVRLFVKVIRDFPEKLDL